jgi:tetratricopeptide (TPR) repeat protein
MQYKNKYRFLILCHLLLISFFSFADNEAPLIVVDKPYELFEQANEAFMQEDFEKAISLYEQISQEFESAELYLNLGNTYYKTGSMAHAIYFYEKALKISPIMEAASQNLAIANQQIIDKIKPKNELDFSSWWYSFLHFRGGNFWAKISILAIGLSCLGFILLKVSKAIKIRQLGFYFFIINLGFALLSTYFAWQQTVVSKTANAAIIFDLKVDVKASPLETAKNLFILHDGTKVEIITKEKDWVEIKIADGSIGWVKAEVLREI